MRVVVMRVLQAAHDEAWLDRFVDAALADRQDNPGLRRWARASGWTAGPEPEPPADQRMLDSKFFDLRELRQSIREAHGRATGGVLPLGLPDAEAIVIRKICDWLPYCLGEVVVKDALALRPDLGSVDARIKQALWYLPELDDVNVVCPIQTQGVAASVVEAFWDGLRQQLGAHRRLFVAIFSGGPELPTGVTPLPSPVLRHHDVAEWTEQMVDRLSWDPPLAARWSSRILVDCGGEPIDTRRMFEVMDRSIRDVLHEREAFRRRLEESI